MIRAVTGGVEIDVRVIPRAKRTQLSGIRDGRLLVRLTAPPSDGAANAALVTFLSEIFRVPARGIHIISGEKDRRKRIAIAGLSVGEVQERLGH